jgi:hypothetical protein
VLRDEYQAIVAAEFIVRDHPAGQGCGAGFSHSLDWGSSHLKSIKYYVVYRSCPTQLKHHTLFAVVVPEKLKASHVLG